MTNNNQVLLAEQVAAVLAWINEWQSATAINAIDTRCLVESCRQVIADLLKARV